MHHEAYERTLSRAAEASSMSSEVRGAIACILRLRRRGGRAAVSPLEEDLARALGPAFHAGNAAATLVGAIARRLLIGSS